MRLLNLILFILIAILWHCTPIFCDTITYAFPSHLGNETVLWFSADTWSGGTVPQAGDDVIIDGRGSETPVHVVISVETPLTVGINRLTLRNATLSVLDKATLHLLNTNYSEPSEIRDSSRLLLLDNAMIRLTDTCGDFYPELGVNACLREADPLLVVFEESSIIADVLTLPFRSSLVSFIEGIFMVRGADSKISIRAGSVSFWFSSIIVTDHARMEIIYPVDDTFESYVFFNDGVVHVDATSSLFIGYDHSLPIGGDCNAGTALASSMRIVANLVNWEEDDVTCQLCVDGVLELRPLPCFTAYSVLEDHVEAEGVLDVRSPRWRLRGYTYIHGGGAVSFSPWLSAPSSYVRISHTALYVGEDTQLFVYGGVRVVLDDEVLLRGCRSFSIDSLVVAEDKYTSSSLYDDDLSVAAKQALATIVLTCEEADTNVWTVPRILTKDLEIAYVLTGGRIDFVSMDPGSSHFLVDTSTYAVNPFSGNQIGVSVGDHVLTGPVFFHVGTSMASVYANETTGLVHTMATVRLEHPLSHVIVARDSIQYNTKIEFDHVSFEMVNNTFLLGSTVDLRATVLNPLAELFILGSVTVEGANGRFILGGATQFELSTSFKITLNGLDSFILIRDGATFGNMIRGENGEHVVPNTVGLTARYWQLGRHSTDNEVAALRLESGAEFLAHGLNELGAEILINQYTYECSLSMVDSYIHLHGDVEVTVNKNTTPAHTLSRSVVHIYDAGEFALSTSHAQLSDFSVLGNGANGANYGKFTVVGVIDVLSSLVTRAVHVTQRVSVAALINLHPNAVLDITDWADLYKFNMVPVYQEADAYESGMAPSCILRTVDSTLPTLWRDVDFFGPMHVYVYGLVEVPGNNVNVRNGTILHVMPTGVVTIVPSGAVKSVLAEDDPLLSIEGGIVRTEAIGRLQVTLPWLLDDGGVLEFVQLLANYGVCLNGTMRDVHTKGVVDVQCHSEEQHVVDVDQCNPVSGYKWNAPSERLRTLRDDYAAWDSACEDHTEQCCVRVKNVSNGIVVTSTFNAVYVVVEEGVPLLKSNFTIDSSSIDLRSSPSDSKFWRLDANSKALKGLSVDRGVRLVMSYAHLGVKKFSSLPARSGENMTTSDALPIVDLFGPEYGASTSWGYRWRLHGYFEAVEYDDVPLFYDPSIVEFSADVEAPLRTMAMQSDALIVAQAGSVLRTGGDVLIASYVDDDIEMILDRSTLHTNCSWSTFELRDVDVELRGGHLKVDCVMVSSGTIIVERDGTVTIDSDGDLSTNSTVRVREGGRVVFAAGAALSGDLHMEPGSLLVLPGGGGVRVGGDMTLDGARILLLYGDGEREPDGVDVVALPRLQVGGALSVGANVRLDRVHVDSDQAALVPASSLTVIGASNVQCDGAVSGLMCDGTGVRHAAAVTKPVCGASSDLSDVSVGNCVDCVRRVSTSCVYVVRDIFTNVQGGFCVGGSPVDGAFSMDNGEASGTFHGLATTVADCFGMAQPRCHQRTSVDECEAFGGKVQAFKSDRSLDANAHCAWCPADVLFGAPRCITLAEALEGFCGVELDVTDVEVDTSSRTTRNLVNTPPLHSTSAAGDTDAIAPETDGDPLLWGLVGGLVVLLLIIVCAILGLFLTRKRRRDGDGTAATSTDSAVSMTRLSAYDDASSLPSSTLSHGVEYSPMPAMAGENAYYATGELNLHAGANNAIVGTYASGDMAAPHLQPSEGEYTDAKEFLNAESSSATYSTGHFGVDGEDDGVYSTGAQLLGDGVRSESVYTIGADAILSKTESSGYETTELKAL